jgi:RHS repeat-associated protein
MNSPIQLINQEAKTNWTYTGILSWYCFGRGYTGSRLLAAGKQLDKFGLINMNGRMYDPVVGRFLSVDPFVQPGGGTQGYNRYSYCLNNPLRYTDPSGFIRDDCYNGNMARLPNRDRPLPCVDGGGAGGSSPVDGKTIWNAYITTTQAGFMGANYGNFYDAWWDALMKDPISSYYEVNITATDYTIHYTKTTVTGNGLQPFVSYKLNYVSFFEKKFTFRFQMPEVKEESYNNITNKIVAMGESVGVTITAGGGYHFEFGRFLTTDGKKYGYISYGFAFGIEIGGDYSIFNIISDDPLNWKPEMLEGNGRINNFSAGWWGGSQSRATYWDGNEYTGNKSFVQSDLSLSIGTPGFSHVRSNTIVWEIPKRPASVPEYTFYNGIVFYNW